MNLLNTISKQQNSMTNLLILSNNDSYPKQNLISVGSKAVVHKRNANHSCYCCANRSSGNFNNVEKSGK